MPASRCVLVYGHDGRLLDTRRLVLSAAGLHVLTAARPEEAERLLMQQPVDLLLLCHTLSETERDAMLSDSRARWPQMKLLLVTTVMQPTPEGPWETVEALAGAEQMIEAARRTLDA